MYTSPTVDICMNQKGPGAVMTGGNLTTLGASVGGTFMPLYMPVKLLAVAVIVAATTPLSSAPILEFYKRVTAGADANRELYCRFANPLSDWISGNVLYYDDTSIIIKPGEELICSTALAASNGFAYRIAYMEPLWENPVNNPRMLRSLT